MSEGYSPNLFLFQSYVGEVLKQAKKILKTAPFQSIDPDNLLNNNKNQHIDAFHQYFLAAMGHLRTRELACNNYEKLIRQGLVDRDHLPPSLISSVLAACAGAGAAGGSTSGSSSLGSASLSSTPQGHSLYIGNMIKTILLSTSQPTTELVQGLNYLLEGTRKKNALLYNAMLQEVYSNQLIRYREPPLKRFVGQYIQMLLDQVEVHFDEENYVFSSRTLDSQTGKFDMATYKEGGKYGKFGRCFSCGKEATHYLKEEWLPICGLSCRQKVKSMLNQCHYSDPFNLLNWLLDCLPSGDEAILSFLSLQLQHSVNRNNVNFNQIETILKTLIHQLSASRIVSKPFLQIICIIITKWQLLIPKQSITLQIEIRLQNYFKVYLLQIINFIEQVPISKQFIDSITFMCQILSNDKILINLFQRFDSKFFQLPILARMMNLISQYAKKFQSSLNGLLNIVKNLKTLFIDNNMRSEHWTGYGQFIKKREIRKIIVAFNKKPVKGIKQLKKLFESQQMGKISLDEPEQQRPQIVAMIGKDKVQQIERGLQEEIVQENRQNIQDEIVSEQIVGGASSQDIQQQQQKDQKPLDSDLIINKRIDQLKEERQNDQVLNKIEIDKKLQIQKIQNEDTEAIESQKSQTKQQEKQQDKQKEHDQQSRIQQKKQTQQVIQKQKLKDPVEQQINSSASLSPQKKVTCSIGPKQIAIFIRQNIELKSWTQADSKLPIPIPSLSKSKVGQYFGVDDPQVRKVSLEFLNNFDFESLQLDDVMRIVMNSFSLPKQTQQIERIIGDLSLRMQGICNLEDDTSIFQYIYILLMVQTTNHNPQVRDHEKLSLQNHISMCKHVKGGVIKQRAEADYRRIVQNSLVVRMKYPNELIFLKKYINSPLGYSNLFQVQQNSLSRSILLYLWEYLVIGLVWPINNVGLYESTILMGRQDLQDQQKGFFQALRKSPQQLSQPQIIKLAIQYGNDLIGKPWDSVVSLLYTLEQNGDCSTILDKLFTNSSKITPPRLKDFLHALLQFSSSEVRKDILYTRQLFVLRHINNLIEYNIERFNQLSHLCWPLLKNYFKDICLHPRKEISMAAIDSLKQLSLRLVKLRIEAVPHDALLQTFLYVFERSGLQMKDLIANVLLNLITSDLRGGWESIYSILDVLDTKDKQLVVKLIGRLLGEVGLNRLGNLHRLHSICIKQLRVCGDPIATEKLLAQLWDLSAFIDEKNTWLQTIRSIKDIFKISLTPNIIIIFVRLCNKCVQGPIDQNSKPSEKQILGEVIDILLFLLQIRGGASKITALISSLDAISSLSVAFQLKYLIGSCGLLQIFRMFLTCQQRIPFSIFLRKLVIQIYLPSLTENQNIKFEYLSVWCVNECMNHLPTDLHNLKENDKDFEQTLTGLLSKPEVVESQADKDKQHVLIEFPESHKEYYQKSLLHLIFLDIIEAIYIKILEQPSENLQSLKQRIEVAVTESFDCAFRVNRLILLRNFLWNNGFLGGRMLPGLLKQEHRTLLICVRWFNFQKSFGMQKVYLDHYKQTLVNLKKLKQMLGNDGIKDNKGLSVYAHDAEIWIVQSQNGVIQSLNKLDKELKKNETTLLTKDHSDLTQYLSFLLQLNNLPVKVCRSAVQTLHSLYSLTL